MKSQTTSSSPFDGQFIVSDDGHVYTPVVYNKQKLEFDYKYAYILDDIFLPYRGEYKPKKSCLPGVYSHGTNEHVVIMPNEKDEAEYKADTHYGKVDIDALYDGITAKEDTFQIYADGKNAYIPDISINDDPFKRALKEAIITKGIDIDSIKDRFSDRNAVFNFKSVMKGDNKVSTLIFERGCEAFGLGYCIILFDKDKNNIIGHPIDNPDTEQKINTIRKQTGIVSKGIPEGYSIIVSDMDKIEIKGDL
jgi:hypothetical protein